MITQSRKEDQALFVLLYILASLHADKLKWINVPFQFEALLSLTEDWLTLAILGNVKLPV